MKKVSIESEMNVREIKNILGKEIVFKSDFSWKCLRVFV